jgi:hypothetical protein
MRKPLIGAEMTKEREFYRKEALYRQQKQLL